MAMNLAVQAGGPGVENLVGSERRLVTQLREALFERHRRMVDMFRSVNTSKDGNVTAEEFLIALEGAGICVGHEIERMRVQVSEEETARIIAFFDLNGDGRLQYNEFMRILQDSIAEAPCAVLEPGRGPLMPSACEGWSGRLGRSSASDFHGGRDTGRASPRPRSGRSTKGDDACSASALRQALGVSRNGHVAGDMRKVQQAFRSWDTNGDGVVSEEQL